MRPPSKGNARGAFRHRSPTVAAVPLPPSRGPGKISSIGFWGWWFTSSTIRPGALDRRLAARPGRSRLRSVHGDSGRRLWRSAAFPRPEQPGDLSDGHFAARRRQRIAQAADRAQSGRRRRDAGTSRTSADREERVANREEVQRLLDELHGEEADIVRLYHLEGKSYHEISRQTGVPENSIGPALSRARADALPGQQRRHCSQPVADAAQAVVHSLWERVRVRV